MNSQSPPGGTGHGGEGGRGERMAKVTKRQEWLAELREPLERLLRDAENYAAFDAIKPPTERAFSEALNSIRLARFEIRDERRKARQQPTGEGEGDG